MTKQIATLMFADVVGSTRLYDELGDERARALVGGAVASIRDIVAAHRGVVVQEIGDEVAARFDASEDAAAASCAVHAKMHEGTGAPADSIRMPPARIRIGLHRGPVDPNGDVLIEETAKVARWASGNAKADQTLVTRAVLDDLPEIYRSVSRFVDDETWEFVSVAHLEVFEIIWDVEAITACPSEIPRTAQAICSAVEFSQDRTTITLDGDHPVLSVGRGIQNDLVIRDDLVSRHHFSAQFSRGRCTITDNSTNGTYVIIDGETSVAIRRETYPLRDSGVIYLGEPAPQKIPIRFVCR